MVTRIKGRLCAFSGGKPETTEVTLLRNFMALTTMSQEQYNDICDHEITDDERQLIQGKFRILFIEENGEYYLSPFGESFVNEAIALATR